MHHHQCEILHHVSELSYLQHQGAFSKSEHLSLPVFADVSLSSAFGSFCVRSAFSLYTLQQLILPVNCSSILDVSIVFI